MRALHVQRVMLTGGEPLLHSNLWALCDRLRDEGIRITLVTTGLLVAPARRLTSRRASTTSCVSIDGEPDVHDEHPAARGGFDRIDRGVGLLQQLRVAPAHDGALGGSARNHARLAQTIEAIRGAGRRSPVISGGRRQLDGVQSARAVGPTSGVPRSRCRAISCRCWPPRFARSRSAAGTRSPAASLLVELPSSVANPRLLLARSRDCARFRPCAATRPGYRRCSSPAVNCGRASSTRPIQPAPAASLDGVLNAPAAVSPFVATLRRRSRTTPASAASARCRCRCGPKSEAALSFQLSACGNPGVCVTRRACSKWRRSCATMRRQASRTL